MRRRELRHFERTPLRGAQRRLRRSLPFLAVALLLVGLLAPAAKADFGIDTFDVGVRNGEGTIDERAATHPFALDVRLAMNVDEKGDPESTLRTLRIGLPPGLVGNPLSVPRCSIGDFEGVSPRCSGSTQIGVFRGDVTGIGEVTAPLYNLAPSRGAAAVFAVSLKGEPLIQRMRLVGNGAAGAIELESVLPQEPAIVEVEEEIWGTPAGAAHDPVRICQGPDGGIVEGCSSDAPEKPLLTLPASCTGPLRTELTVTSAGPDPIVDTAAAFFRDGGGNPRPLVGCDSVPFEPRFSARADAAALAPSSLQLGFEVPQYEAVGTTAAATVQGMQVELPQGMALNPSAGAWLTGCPPAAVGLESGSGVEPPVFGEAPAGCPPTSRIGSVRVKTPLIDHELNGSVFLAEPGANPFGARYAIYLVVEDEATGTVLKIPGRLDAAPADGQLTATIPLLPQFPFNNLELEFAGGPRAPLAGPPSCGKYSADATLTPSTAPVRLPVVRTSTFLVYAGSEDPPCPAPESERDPTPSFRAGTDVARAGSDSPLAIHIARAAADQHFGSFDLTLPPGLIGNLGSAPLGATVGSAQIKAGLGPEPVTLGGAVHLGGPYRGAPYSLETVVPAQVGPFDLGTIVQRAALEVDPLTAQISVRSDAFPQILGGVPLELRSLALRFDRPGFIRNPTSCEPMAIAGTATTSLGQTAPLSNRFQVGDCPLLPFKPKAALRFAGSLRRNGHPAVRAILRSHADEASISSARFTLPPGELLDLRHVRGLCAQGVAPGRCPAGSRLGQLRLVSSFLGGPATGSVYLVRPSHRLPELLAEVRSGSLRFVLHGRIAIRGGHFGVSFPAIPDIPLSRAELSLDGGRWGLFVNSRSLCRGVGRAEAGLGAHNGKRRELHIRPRIDGRC